MALSKQVHALVTRWREIQSRGGQLDFDIAEFSRDARAGYPFWDAFYAFFADTLGERATARVRMYSNMADALSAVPDPAVWRAVGWRDVQNIARIEVAKKRQAACERILAAASAKRTKVGPSTVDVILAEEAPDIFLPRPAVPETKKDREQVRMAAEQKVAAKPTGPSPVERLLVAALKRLLAGPLGPSIEAQLKAEERKALGLAKRGKAS